MVFTHPFSPEGMEKILENNRRTLSKQYVYLFLPDTFRLASLLVVPKVRIKIAL